MPVFQEVANGECLQSSSLRYSGSAAEASMKEQSKSRAKGKKSAYLGRRESAAIDKEALTFITWSESVPPNSAWEGPAGSPSQPIPKSLDWQNSDSRRGCFRSRLYSPPIASTGPKRPPRGLRATVRRVLYRDDVKRTTTGTSESHKSFRPSCHEPSRLPRVTFWYMILGARDAAHALDC